MSEDEHQCSSDEDVYTLDIEEYHDLKTDSSYRFTVNSDIHELAINRTEHGELAKMHRMVEYEAAFGETRTEYEQLKAEKEELEDEKDDVDARMRELRSRRESIERRLIRIDNRLENMDSIEDKIESKFESLETLVCSGMHLDKNHPLVEEAAQVADIHEEDVLDRLKDRLPNVPEYAFKPKMHAPKNWHGMSVERARQQPAEE